MVALIAGYTTDQDPSHGTTPNDLLSYHTTDQNPSHGTTLADLGHQGAFIVALAHCSFNNFRM